MDDAGTLLSSSLAHFQAAKRVSGINNSYRKDNPLEYAKIVAYLGGGPRPSGVTTEMGKALLLEEDARRALLLLFPQTNTRTQYGLHQDLCYFGDPQLSQDIGLATNLHAEISRSTLIWKDIETAPGVFDWTKADNVVSKLDSAGLAPLFYIGTWPSWLPGYRGQWTAPTQYDQAVLAYARFCALAADRYRADVKHWEIWNEQNEHNFWGTVSGYDSWQALYEYATLYMAARGAIKDANPSALVSVGGLAGVQAGDEAFHSGLGWLDEFLKIVPAKSVDRVAIHPYTSDGQAPDITRDFRDNFSSIQATRDFLDSKGRQDVRLWVTEWGWRTEVVGVTNQAAYVKKSLEMIRDLYPFVELAVFFSDRDKGGVQSGLYAANYAERPAAGNYRNFTASL